MFAHTLYFNRQLGGGGGSGAGGTYFFDPVI